MVQIKNNHCVCNKAFRNASMIAGFVHNETAIITAVAVEISMLQIPQRAPGSSMPIMVSNFFQM